MKYISLTLLFLFQILFSYAGSENITILVDAAILKKENPDKIMLDGTVYADIDNDNIEDAINYSYHVSTPPAACSDENCIIKNNTLSLSPILMFNIFLKGPSASIQVDYMCTTIGIMNSLHNGMKDIYCGPSSILQWDGENYILEE